MSRHDVSSHRDEESDSSMEVDTPVESTLTRSLSNLRNIINEQHDVPNGIHLAQEDGQNFVFPRPNCVIICGDGVKIHVNNLHAAAISSYFSIVLIQAPHREKVKSEIGLSYFKGIEVVDAFEMVNFVLQKLNTDRKPLSASHLPEISLNCAFRVLQVASYLQIKYLLVPLADFIDKNIDAQYLVKGHCIAKVTCASLAQRLWLRILLGFMALYENRTFLLLTEEELIALKNDPRLNVLWTFDDVFTKVYHDYYKEKTVRQTFHNRIHAAVRTRSLSVGDNAFGKNDTTYPTVFHDLDDFIDPVATEALPIVNSPSTMTTTTVTTTMAGATSSLGISRLPRSVVLCTGGWGDNGPTERVEVYDYHREQWNPPADPSIVETVRAYHGLHVSDYGILCMGGFNGRQNFRSASLFNFETLTWKYICASVDIRCYVSIGTLDKDHIIACGGYTGQTRLRSTEIYNYRDNGWLRVGPMNVVRSDAKAVTLGSPANGTCKVYMIGGFDGRQCHRSLEYYDPVRDEWIAERNSMNTKRSGVGAVGIGENVIIAMGGFNGANRLSTTEFYDTREAVWHDLGALNTSRSNFGSCLLEEEPWVFGGYNNERTIAECERFDSRMNRWVIMPSMNGSRSALASTTLEHPEMIKKIIHRGTNVPLSVSWDESVGAFVPSNNGTTL